MSDRLDGIPQKGGEIVKINEVEALVGITKKNIRFYEDQGLLAPRRNSENGYRDYGEPEVSALRRIKLMRKLGVSLEEIRQMQAGNLTVADGMRRHLVTLERDRENLEQSIRLCGRLTGCRERLEELDAGAILEEMAAMEQSGTSFQNKQKQDIRVQYVAPVVISLGMTILMGGLIALMVWMFSADAPEAPFWPLLAVLIAIPLLIAAGTLLALVQRLREIRKGEMNDAKNY